MSIWEICINIQLIENNYFVDGFFFHLRLFLLSDFMISPISCVAKLLLSQKTRLDYFVQFKDIKIRLNKIRIKSNSFESFKPSITVWMYLSNISVSEDIKIEFTDKKKRRILNYR